MGETGRREGEVTDGRRGKITECNRGWREKNISFSLLHALILTLQNQNQAFLHPTLKVCGPYRRL